MDTFIDRTEIKGSVNYQYHYIRERMKTMDKPLVSVIMGSDSDLPVMKEALDLLKELEIPYEERIVSAHRTPERMYIFAKEAEERGVQVIIAGAGGAAHLPGMVASLSALPVIGVPIKSKNLQGVDSLHSIVQMPPGIPVATMAINGSKNAGIFAAKILGLKDPGILQRVKDYMEALEDQVEKKAKDLESMGYEAYLNKKF
ncbi:5-(carboxyamino)imidazole ribonucleotide mutase [Isachenkonia alkalipeptolytica]